MKYKPFLLTREKEMMFFLTDKNEIGAPCDVYIEVSLERDERARVVVPDKILWPWCFYKKNVYIGNVFDDELMEIAERKIKELDDETIAMDVREIKNWCLKVSYKSVLESERLIRAIAEDAAEEETYSLVGVADYMELPDFEKIEPFSVDENCAKGEGWFVINNKNDYNVYVIIYDIDKIDEYGYDGLTLGSMWTIEKYFKWNPYSPLYFGDKYLSEDGLEKAKEYLRKCPKEVLRSKMLERNAVLWLYSHGESDEPNGVSMRKFFLQDEKKMMKFIKEETAKGNYRLYV